MTAAATSIAVPGDAVPVSAPARTILLLQGPPSPFWRELADAFQAAGHQVLHINLCAADRLYWALRSAVDFTGSFAKWPGFIERFVVERKVTDILFYSDQFPYHRVAAEVAARHGIAAIAIEFGYLRPGWLTLERDAMGARSHFPSDPDSIRAIARSVPKPDLERKYVHRFQVEATNEVVFHLTNVFLFYLYPLYRSDRYYPPLIEYLSSFLRSVRGRRRRGRFDQVLGAAAAGEWPYDLVALQLQSDYQMRRNSPYTHQREMLAAIFASFAARAPKDRHIIVKVHPMDVGLIDWVREVETVAGRFGIPERVHAVDGGDLAALVAGAHGVIVTNSTVGLHAIRAGRPTKVMGFAIFDVAGLTHQGGIDTFWTEAEAVDRGLADDFVRALAGTIQIKGSFYEASGRATARAEIVARVAAGRVNEPGGFVDPPPRLAEARRLGLPD